MLSPTLLQSAARPPRRSGRRGRARVNIRPGTQGDVKAELLRRIKSTFEREGIEMPYPQHVVHLVDERAAP